MDIIAHKRIFLTISAILVLASIISAAVFGLNLGIDFTGGALLEIEFSGERPSPPEVRNALEAIAGNVTAQPTGERGMILRFRTVDESTHQAILGALGYPEEKRFDSIGPVIGSELARKALIALGTAILAIMAYIAWAFRKVSKPVSSWKYGVVAIAALAHDVIIPIGIFAFLGWWAQVELDLFFVSALLTILGFSVHDTIVVFDRIRENLQDEKSAEPYDTVVAKSINQTITRSINTSLTTFFVLAAVFLWGGQTITYFALALILGIVFGTYSSIFVASPLLVVWQQVSTTKK